MKKYPISFLSGVLAGVIMDVADYVSFFIQKAFNLKHIVNADYMAAALLQGKASHNLFEFVSGQLFHLVFTGTVGCLYLLFLTAIRGKNTVFLGWLFAGIGVWFSAFMLGVFYKIELFVKAEMNTVVSDFITASIFGIALSMIVGYFERRYKAPLVTV